MSQLPDAGVDPQTGQSESVIYKIFSPVKSIRTSGQVSAAGGFTVKTEVFTYRSMQNGIFYHENSFESPTAGHFSADSKLIYQVQPAIMDPEDGLGSQGTTTKTLW